MRTPRAAHSGRRALAWSMQVAAAAILAQTLFFKFTGAAESVFIFRTLGMEPWGRLGSGAAELAAAVLLLTPRGAVYGALVAAGVISGAIAAHLAVLGVEVRGDGGLLFGLALAVLACSAGVVWLRRGELSGPVRRLAPCPACRRGPARAARP